LGKPCSPLEVETMQDRKARFIPLILIALLLITPLPAGSALPVSSSDRTPALQADGPAGDPLSFAPAAADLWQAECVDCPPQIQGFGDRSIQLDSSGRPHIAYAGAQIYYARYDGLAWQIEVVEDVVGAAFCVSLALDAADHPHLAYSNPSDGNLKYAWHDGVNWHVEIVDSMTDSCSLALDGAGRPHIGYLDSTTYDLKYAWHDGTSWHVETVDGGGDVGYELSMALETSGRPHISYYKTTNRNLKYAWHDGSGWHIETVDNVGDVGRYPSLAVDSSGQVHISYHAYGSWEGGDESLKYARHDGTGWHIETVATGWEVGQNTSLVLDADGRPHISYEEDFGDLAGLRYAWYDGAAWHVEAVPDPGRVGWSTSLALDGEGLPHIAYLDLPDYSHIHLKYAHYDGTAWQTEYVDYSRKLGADPSLALDAAGRPHVSYREAVGPGLKYAWYDGSSWHSQWVDPQARNAEFTSLALDAADRPHIAYHYWDGITSELRYARYDGANWLVATVDGAAGARASLALDSAGQPHISYAGSHGPLKYARYVGGAWNIQIVDPLATSVTATSLALDGADHPHIGYTVWDSSAGDQLQYAWFDGLSWQVEVVIPSDYDTSIDTGEQLLALDANGQPHLIYSTWGVELTPTLNYAWRDGTGWHVEIVDSSGHSFSRAALVLDTAGRPHISYDESDSEHLKYAWHDGMGWQIEQAAVIGWGTDASLALDTAGQARIAFGYSVSSVYWLKYAQRTAPLLSLDKQNVPRADVSPGETITYSLALDGPGIEVRLWDPLPAGVAYVAGSLTPPAIYSPTANAVEWHGILPTDTSQVVAFQVTLTLSGTPLANTAWLTDVAYGLVVSSTAIVNAYRHYLPVVWRYVP
jgi:hypothetical protein